MLIGCNNSYSNKNKLSNKPVDSDSEVVEISEDSINQKTNSSSQDIPDKEPEIFNYNTIISKNYSDTAHHFFTNKKTKDRFVFIMPKGNIDNTISTIKILNSENIVLFEKSFETYYLINGYDLYEIKSDNEMMAYVYRKAKEIISDKKFDKSNELKNSYITQMAKDDFLDYDTFLYCQSNGSWLFTLSLGEEDNTTYGFNPKKGVMPLISCC
jgi:hypothetical protein